MQQTDTQLIALMEAEKKAEALFDAIEEKGFIQAGRTEREIERDIYALAESDFGVKVHWHKRVVRTGINTLAIASDNPPIRTVEEDDIVFLDLGPVFEEWEADVGRSYVVGDHAGKKKLCADLEIIFEALVGHYHTHPDITGAELYEEAVRQAEQAGWLFGGAIAGHIVGEFPHARMSGDKNHHRISPANPTRLNDPDPEGRPKNWIIEVHLVDQARQWGGFYERLAMPASAGRPAR